MEKGTPYFADHSSDLNTNRPQLKMCFPKVATLQVCLLLRPLNILLRLKSWHLAEKPVFPPKYSRGGICTTHPKKWKQT
jgi:hypothetical protein